MSKSGILYGLLILFLIVAVGGLDPSGGICTTLLGIVALVLLLFAPHVLAGLILIPFAIWDKLTKE